MKKFKVSFRPLAEADLFRLYDYLADEAGPDVAGGYIARIEAACLALEAFPARGTRRDDIRPGIRTLGFERRATIDSITARMISAIRPVVIPRIVQ